jgi:transposase-like protein
MSKKKVTRRRFTPEFKAEAEKQGDRPMAAVPMELGIGAKSVGE